MKAVDFRMLIYFVAAAILINGLSKLFMPQIALVALRNLKVPSLC